MCLHNGNENNKYNNGILLWMNLGGVGGFFLWRLLFTWLKFLMGDFLFVAVCWVLHFQVEWVGLFFFFFLVFSAISTSRFLSLSPRIRWSWFGFLYHTRGPTIVTSYWCRFRYFTASVMHIWCSNSKTISFYVITLMLSRIILCSYSLYATSKGCITKSCSLRITLYYECISIKVLHQ